MQGWTLAHFLQRYYVHVHSTAFEEYTTVNVVTKADLDHVEIVPCNLLSLSQLVDLTFILCYM